MKVKGHADNPPVEKKASRSKGGNKGLTIANIRRRRDRHLKKYPGDIQAVEDIRNARRWKEAQP